MSNSFISGKKDIKKEIFSLLNEKEESVSNKNTVNDLRLSTPIKNIDK